MGNVISGQNIRKNWGTRLRMLARKGTPSASRDRRSRVQTFCTTLVRKNAGKIHACAEHTSVTSGHGLFRSGHVTSGHACAMVRPPSRLLKWGFVRTHILLTLHIVALKAYDLFSRDRMVVVLPSSVKPL
jgi:hypothetical protein